MNKMQADARTMTLDADHRGLTTVSRGSDGDPPTSHVTATAVESQANARR